MEGSGRKDLRVPDWGGMEKGLPIDKRKMQQNPRTEQRHIFREENRMETAASPVDSQWNLK